VPSDDYPDFGIMYVALGNQAFTAAIAETFQDSDGQTTGPIDRRYRRPMFTMFESAEALVLLNLNSGWITRAGGNQAICSGSRAMAQAWAREIYAAHPVDGVFYGSSIWGPGSCAAIWERGERAVPSAPLVSRSLEDPYLDGAIASAAIALNAVVF
jgi:hypothetical protein